MVEHSLLIGIVMDIKIRIHYVNEINEYSFFSLAEIRMSPFNSNVRFSDVKPQVLVDRFRKVRFFSSLRWNVQKFPQQFYQVYPIILKCFRSEEWIWSTYNNIPYRRSFADLVFVVPLRERSYDFQGEIFNTFFRILNL